MPSEPTPAESFDDEVPIPDAVDQRRQVGDAPRLSEDFEPTEVNEIAEAGTPVDANPADWQEQWTSAETDDWDPDVNL